MLGRMVANSQLSDNLSKVAYLGIVVKIALFKYVLEQGYYKTCFIGTTHHDLSSSTVSTQQHGN